MHYRLETVAGFILSCPDRKARDRHIARWEKMSGQSWEAFMIKGKLKYKSKIA